MRISYLFLALVLSFNVFAARVEVDVKGMTCGMCVSAITKELELIEKTTNISVNLEDKKARFDEVKGKKISDSEIKAAAQKAGYEVVKISRK